MKQKQLSRLMRMSWEIQKRMLIYTQMFQQDNLDLYEESVRIENSQIKTFIKTWQHGHCSFANRWLKNIKQQGFLKQGGINITIKN